ncbi:hypothetical protein F2981_17580 [Sinorhizobium meliloti]|nr:hypothetical protein [Sinorhizobium meliloti]
MKVSFRTSLAAFALSSALAGVAVPAFAGQLLSGIDPHNPPGTQNRGAGNGAGPSVLRRSCPDRQRLCRSRHRRAAFMSIRRRPAASTWKRRRQPASNAPGRVREHYTNEYQGPGDGDYYQGISPRLPVPKHS